MKKLPEPHPGTKSAFGGVNFRVVIQKVNEIVDYINEREGLEKEEVPDLPKTNKIIGLEIG